MPFAAYLAESVLAPLGLGATLQGSPAWGLAGSLRDLLALGCELLEPTLVARETLDEATSVVFPGLVGVLPGFGRQERNDWGLGFELRDGKEPHWTGTRQLAGDVRPLRRGRDVPLGRPRRRPRARACSPTASSAVGARGVARAVGRGARGGPGAEADSAARTGPGSRWTRPPRTRQGTDPCHVSIDRVRRALPARSRHHDSLHERSDATTAAARTCVPLPTAAADMTGDRPLPCPERPCPRLLAARRLEAVADDLVAVALGLGVSS